MKGNEEKKNSSTNLKPKKNKLTVHACVIGKIETADIKQRPLVLQMHHVTNIYISMM